MLIYNYFKIAIRNILRDKFYTVINISGLAIGIACTIFIFLYIQDELGYDKYHKNHKQIFRVEEDFNISGKQDRIAASAFPIGIALEKEIPEVEGFVRFNMVGKQLFRYDDKEFYEEDIFFADSSLTNIFTHNFIHGLPDKALTEPYTMIISQSLAEKYFGKENPIGKIITSGSNNSFKITAVFEDLPKNIHLRYDGIISMATMDALYSQRDINGLEPPLFWSVQVYTYIIINKEAKIEDVRAKLPAIYDKYMAGIGEQLNASCKLMLSPLTEIHLHSDLHWDLPTGNIAYIYVLSVVAIFLLIIACINYMNLATARSATRAKEVGMRKVVGADRAQLTNQFLNESLILSIIALIIAIGIVEILLPGF
ncbi:ABC transporter permease, partial [Bacteroidota bacterium]